MIPGSAQGVKDPELLQLQIAAASQIQSLAQELSHAMGVAKTKQKTTGLVNYQYNVVNKSIILVQPLWKTVWRFPEKLKIELLYDTAIPLLGIYPKKTIIRKDTCIPMFTAALFTIAKAWKQPKCPLTEE